MQRAGPLSRLGLQVEIEGIDMDDKCNLVRGGFHAGSHADTGSVQGRGHDGSYAILRVRLAVFLPTGGVISQPVAELDIRFGGLHADVVVRSVRLG